MISHWQLDELLGVSDDVGGSSCTLYVVRHRDVTSLPSPPRPDQEATGSIEIKVQNSLVKYEFQADSVQLSEQSETRGGGKIMSVTLTGFRQGNDLSHRHEITKLLPGQYIIVHQDANGRRRLLGSLDRPFIFSCTTTTGGTPDDIPGIDWQFTGTQVGESVYIPSSSEAPATTTTDPCSLITNTDINFTWSLSGSNDVNHISLAIAPTSSITSIDTYGDGAIYGPVAGMFNPATATKVADMIYNAGNSRYEVELADQPANIGTAGSYYFYIPTLNFSIGATACANSFQSAQLVILDLFNQTYNPTTDWQYQNWDTSNTNELNHILVDPTTGANIQSVDSRPDGTITFPDGTTTATVVWSVANSRYEPSGTVTFPESGNYVLNIPGVQLTLTNGTTGTVTFSQTFAYTFVNQQPNQPPVVTNVRIEGTIATGNLVTLTGDFSDPDGDGNASTLQLKQYDNVEATDNEVLLGTFSHGDTFTLPETSSLKYLVLTYNPLDDQSTVGVSVNSSIYGPVDIGGYATPTDYANVFRWWDMSTSLNDQMGSGDNLTETFFGSSPVFAANVSTDGNTGAYQFANAKYFQGDLTGLSSRAYTLFFAIQLNTTATQLQYPVRHQTRGFGFYYQTNYGYRTAGTPSGGGQDSNVATPSSSHALPDSWRVGAMRIDPIDGGNDQHSYWLGETKFYNQSLIADKYTIPTYVQIGQTMEGYVGEVICCNAAMTDVEVVKMIKYLNARWL